MSKPVKIVIVEDEIVTAVNIQQSLDDAGYHVSGIADEADAAIALIKQTQPDLVILDIQLIGEKDGIWIAEQINEHFKLPFIFLTSFGDKVSITRAVRTRPYGYLLKPFDETDILESITIALKNFSRKQEAALPELKSAKQEPDESMVIKEAIFVRHNNVYLKVNFEEILFIQADKNYVDILTENKKYTLRSSLKDMFLTLPPNAFIQISKSCIANLKQIDGYGKDIVLIKQHELTLGENYKEGFLQKLNSI